MCGGYHMRVPRRCVADRDQHIAEKPVTAGALDWRSREKFAESRIIEPRELGESRRRQLIARQKVRLPRRPREFVPRTDGEAVVATVNTIADRRAQLDRNHPLVLDRQIRNAAPGIELVGSGERRGRTRIQAAVARAAMVRFSWIGIELEAQIDLAEKEPGAELPGNQVGVLALPAQPGALGERLLHNWSGVDKKLQRSGPMLLDPMRERLKAALQGVMIIAASRVDRNRADFGRVRERQRVVLGRVAHDQPPPRP